MNLSNLIALVNISGKEVRKLTSFCCDRKKKVFVFRNCMNAKDGQRLNRFFLNKSSSELKKTTKLKKKQS